MTTPKKLMIVFGMLGVASGATVFFTDFGDPGNATGISQRKLLKRARQDRRRLNQLERKFRKNRRNK